MAGWYRMHRGWMEHPVFRREALDRRGAFVWLIENAAYQPTAVRLPGGNVTLERGQLGHSIRYLATAWRWDEKKVRRFLTSLREAEIIAADNAAGQMVITICKYETYQAQQEDAAAAAADQPPQPRRTSAAKNKEGKEREEGKGARAPSATSDYAFVGRTIRLNRADFERWRATYSTIPDLAAELTSIDGWFADQPEAKRKGWFQATQGMLNRRHQENLRAGKKPVSDEREGVADFVSAFIRREEQRTGKPVQPTPQLKFVQ